MSYRAIAFFLPLIVAAPLVAQQRTLTDLRAQYDGQVMAVNGVVGVGTGINGLLVLTNDASVEPRVRTAVPGLFRELTANGIGVEFRVTGPIVAQRTLADIRAQYDGQVMAVAGVVGVGTGANGLVIYLRVPSAEARVRAAVPALFRELTANGIGASFVVTGPIVAQRTLSDIRAQYDGQVMAVAGVVGVGTGANGLVIYLRVPSAEASVRAAVPALFRELTANGIGASFVVTGPIVAQRTLSDIRNQYEAAILALNGVVGLGEGAQELVVYVELPADVPTVGAGLPAALRRDLQDNGLGLRLEAIGVIVAQATLQQIRDRLDAAVLALQGVAGVGSGQTGLVVYVERQRDLARIQATLPAVLRAELAANGFDVQFLVTGPIVAQRGDWQPLGRRDRWTFREQRSGSRAESWVGRRIGSWRRVGLLDLGVQWVAYHRDRLYVYDAGRPVRVFDFTLSTGDGIDVDLEGRDSGRMVLAARGELVATPAGTFRCTRFDWVGSRLARGWGSFWFAPGVGLVKWTQRDVAVPRTHELVEARVGGQEFPAVTTLPAIPSGPSILPAR